MMMIMEDEKTVTTTIVLFIIWKFLNTVVMIFPQGWKHSFRMEDQFLSGYDNDGGHEDVDSDDTQKILMTMVGNFLRDGQWTLYSKT